MGLPVRPLRNFRIKGYAGAFRYSVILKAYGGGSTGGEHGASLLIDPAAPAVHIDKAGAHYEVSLVL